MITIVRDGITVYQCPVCHIDWSTEVLAIECESLLEPEHNLAYAPGDVIYMGYGAQFVIEGIEIRQADDGPPRHTWGYRVTGALGGVLQNEHELAACSYWSKMG